jgi:hypothetical protein
LHENHRETHVTKRGAKTTTKLAGSTNIEKVSIAVFLQSICSRY